MLKNVKWCQKDYSEICTYATFLLRGPLSILTYVQLVSFHVSCLPRSLSQKPCESGRRMWTRSWQAGEVAGGRVCSFCVTTLLQYKCGGGHLSVSVRGILPLPSLSIPKHYCSPPPTPPPAGVYATSFHFDSIYSSSWTTSNALLPATHPWHGCAADSQNPVSPGNQPPMCPGSSSMLTTP